MFPLLVLLPLVIAVAAIAAAGGRPQIRHAVRYIAILASATSLILLYFVSQGVTTIPWFTVGGYQFSITTLVTPLNMLLLFIVFFMATVILVYSSGFMDVPNEQRRFYVEMLAFETAMAAFAMSGNFVLLFVSWGFLSAFSYLLIGFWYERARANRAARQTITMILIGDLALIASIVIFWNATGSLEFTTIAASLSQHASAQAYLGALLLLVAIFTKSAQFPFQEWLSGAMEGPTPVSAFLHSSTMVKAGVFLVIILLPIFTATSLTGIILAVGIITAVVATLNAMRDLHIKKVLAYSTIQELALMMVAAAGGAVTAAVYFFLIQSFYKALLFFGAGVVMKSTDEEYFDKAAGLRSSRLAYLTTLFGILALAGFIPFSGFFSSVGIGGAFSANIPMYIVISMIGLGTSFFAFRWFLLASRDVKDRRVRYRYSTQPASMVYAMVLLAVLTLASSAAYFYIQGFIGKGFMSQLYMSKNSSLPAISLGDISGLAIVAALAVAGAVAGYLVYASKRFSARLASINTRKVDIIAHSSVAMEALYSHSARFVYELAEGAALFDLYVSDISDYIGHGTMRLGSMIRRVSVGQINPYALIFAGGIAVLLILVYVMILL